MSKVRTYNKQNIAGVHVSEHVTIKSDIRDGIEVAKITIRPADVPVVTKYKYKKPPEPKSRTYKKDPEFFDSSLPNYDKEKIKRLQEIFRARFDDGFFHRANGSVEELAPGSAARFGWQHFETPSRKRPEK